MTPPHSKVVYVAEADSIFAVLIGNAFVFLLPLIINNYFKLNSARNQPLCFSITDKFKMSEEISRTTYFSPDFFHFFSQLSTIDY
jgi:hypothetical protein